MPTTNDKVTNPRTDRNTHSDRDGDRNNDPSRIRNGNDLSDANNNGWSYKHSSGGRDLNVPRSRTNTFSIGDIVTNLNTDPTIDRHQNRDDATIGNPDRQTHPNSYPITRTNRHTNNRAETGR